MDNFEEITFREFVFEHTDLRSNVIKSENSEISGKTKVTVDEDEHDGVKIILKKDEHDVIKEIKFVCTCGQTKTVLLDYNE